LLDDLQPQGFQNSDCGCITNPSFFFISLSIGLCHGITPEFSWLKRPLPTDVR
jgi:hypothetical protein